MAVWYIVLMLVWLCYTRLTNASTCSWSNEGCNDDSECCSKSCFLAHEGTNARCRHSTLGERCVFDYHCQDTLVCGSHFNCCSPFWKICIKDSDCCEPVHVCRAAVGYLYNRCLFAHSTPAVYRNIYHHLPLLLSSALVSWMLLKYWLQRD
ncbi:uncharacterized protein LOC131937179 [Physella acuta]|uniref:uncharacterized protein LOC131937179 n=1 Tax=Physella acuta TaxID=109671 RepID=UPI0027DB9648|nr:uncharacterized protein LOC131937179 [Physella acuta]